MLDFDKRLDQTNARLKAGRVGVAIQLIGGHLYLRATLPAKPDSPRAVPYQQRIALSIYANPEGLQQAEAEAKKLGALLACREFSWLPFLKETHTKPASVTEWVERCKSEYFLRRRQNNKTETTWRGDYLKVFNRLPQNELLTAKILQKVIAATEADSKTRKRTCMALGMLAKCADITLDTKSLAGNYSPHRVSPRQIPSDEIISQVFHGMKNPAWRWVYGIIAAYGLRPHEVFHLDLESLKQGSYIAYVQEGKTGARRVWPCFPEWFEEFRLKEVQLPGIKLDRPNSAIGSSCGHYFHITAKLPFVLYDLRHAWAIRTLEFGLEVSLAAQQMGHSVQVHCDLYHHWISERHHQRAFEMLMLRSDRPLAPQSTKEEDI